MFLMFAGSVNGAIRHPLPALAALLERAAHVVEFPAASAFLDLGLPECLVSLAGSMAVGCPVAGRPIWTALAGCMPHVLTLHRSAGFSGRAASL